MLEKWLSDKEYFLKDLDNRLMKSKLNRTKNDDLS